MSIQHFFGSKFPAFLNQSFHILGQERCGIPGGKIVRCQKPKIRANTQMRIKKLIKLGPKSCETVLPALVLFFMYFYPHHQSSSNLFVWFTVSPLSDSPVIMSATFVSTRHAWPHHQSFTDRIFNLGLPSQDSDQRFQLRSPNLSTVLNLALSVGSWRWISWRNFKHHFFWGGNSSS